MQTQRMTGEVTYSFYYRVRHTWMKGDASVLAAQPRIDTPSIEGTHIQVVGWGLFEDWGLRPKISSCSSRSLALCNADDLSASSNAPLLALLVACASYVERKCGRSGMAGRL